MPGRTVSAEELLKEAKGREFKKDSLITIAEKQFKVYNRSLTIADSVISLQRRNLAIKQENEAILNSKFDIVFADNLQLTKQNKKLNFEVKALKIGIPVSIGIGAVATYLILK